MYDFKAGQLAPEEVLPIIRRSVSLRGWSLVPVWTRHHWATSVVTPHGNSLRVVVYDSAAAPPTRRDFITLWRRLGISAKVIQHRRQPRDSFECGLHICLLAIVLATSERAPRDFQNSLEVLSLDTWRRALLLSGPDAMNIDTVLECAPAAASLLQSVSGGAITQRYKVDRTRPQTVNTHRRVAQHHRRRRRLRQRLCPSGRRSVLQSPRRDAVCSIPDVASAAPTSHCCRQHLRHRALQLSFRVARPQA
eukprot:PhM_4_TR16755/c1_g1_i6/m.26690